MKRWLLGGLAAAIVLGVGGPFVYFRFIEGPAPKPLSLESSTTSNQGAAGSTDGTWKVAPGSVVGYRVKELLFGQSNVAVGRTNDVTGEIEVEETTVRHGSFTADMTTVRSDRERRDAQFQGRIMNTSTYPTSTFAFEDPIEVGSVPAEGEKVRERATGRLTLHGVTETVKVNVTGQREGNQIKVAGSIPITFADWNIPNPSFGPARTEDRGLLEFSLLFTHA